MIEVKKIDEWLECQGGRQFETLFKETSPIFCSTARRLVDRVVFACGDYVFNKKLEEHGVLIYFDNDYIHFNMTSGRRWEANDVVALWK